MGMQLPALVAFEIGEEAEAAFIACIEQHDADIGQAILIHRRQRHGIGVVGLRLRGQGEPFLEHGERVQIGAIAVVEQALGQGLQHFRLSSLRRGKLDKAGCRRHIGLQPWAKQRPTH
ncbi:hypothetical protein D3C72_2166470 [compost metagenome]